MAQARAKVFAFACIDPRFLRALETFVEKKFSLNPTEHDIKTDAGGVNRICRGGPVSEWLLENAELAYQKHDTRVFVLCNHMGCSYYKHTHNPANEEEEVEIYERDIQAAATLLKSRLPDVEILGYIVRFKDGKKPKHIFRQVQLEFAAAP